MKRFHAPIGLEFVCVILAKNIPSSSKNQRQIRAIGVKLFVNKIFIYIVELFQSVDENEGEEILINTLSEAVTDVH